MIYKASKDGYGNDDFYKKCNHKGGATITIIKSEHGLLFGGYTSIFWKRFEY